jgi:hypothetical protein
LHTVIRVIVYAAEEEEVLPEALASNPPSARPIRKARIPKAKT